MARWPKPAEGSWTEHYPELGTGPISFRRFHVPGVLRTGTGGDLQTRLAQRRPRGGSAAGGELLHQGDRGGTLVGHRGQGQRRTDPRLPQRLPAPRQQAGVERFPERGNPRHLPAVHLQVPRLALRPPPVRCTFVQQESEFFDLDRDGYGLVPVHCDVWTGSSSSTSTASHASRYASSSVRWSPGSTTTRSTAHERYEFVARQQQQLEDLRRRVPGVLPRAVAAPAAGARRGP